MCCLLSRPLLASLLALSPWGNVDESSLAAGNATFISTSGGQGRHTQNGPIHCGQGRYMCVEAPDLVHFMLPPTPSATRTWDLPPDPESRSGWPW